MKEFNQFLSNSSNCATNVQITTNKSHPSWTTSKIYLPINVVVVVAAAAAAADDVDVLAHRREA